MCRVLQCTAHRNYMNVRNLIKKYFKENKRLKYYQLNDNKVHLMGTKTETSERTIEFIKMIWII